MMSKIFCEECRDNVEYVVSEKKMVERLNSKNYEYVGKEARCTKCNSLVYVGEINDSNLKALYDVYRQKNGIISLEKIRDIPKKNTPLTKKHSRYCWAGKNKHFCGTMTEICHQKVIPILF